MLVVYRRFCLNILSFEIGDGKSFGNVYLSGVPICHHSWGIRSAEVVCRYLGKFSLAAKPTQRSLWGKTGDMFVLDDVICSGNEKYITDCSHNTNDDCSEGEGAGVVCFEPTSVKLSEVDKGFVMAMDRPIVSTVWSIKESQVICNKLFGKSFSPKKVPVFNSSLEIYPSPMQCVISNVKCTGNEHGIEHCSYDAINNCPTNKTVPKVSCAVCTEADFITMIESLDMDGSRKEQYLAIIKQLKFLQSKCRNWDCSGGENDFTYPEFCIVKSFLEDWKSLLEPTQDNKVVYLENKFYYSKLLEQSLLQRKFSSLRNDIFSLSVQTSSFQKSLANHFKVLAQFDEMKIKKDLKLLTTRWNKGMGDFRDQASILQMQLDGLLNMASAVIDADIANNVGNVVLQTIELIFDPFSLFGIADAAHDATVTLSKMKSKSRHIQSIASNEIPKIQRILAKIATRMENNQKTYLSINTFFEEAQNGEFSLDTARKFLIHYKSFRRAIDAVQVAALEESIIGIVETICKIIDDNSCMDDDMKLTIKTIIVIFNEMGDHQKTIIKGYAALAKAKLSESSANNLANVLNTNLKNKFKCNLAKAMSSFQLREQKRILIEEACNEITYLNHGVEETFCSQMKTNIDMDTSKLIGYKRKDMCTNKMITKKMVFLPTLSWNDTSSHKLNLRQLLRKSNDTYWKTAGSALLKISDEKWLIDNGWINKGEKGPFFVKNIEIFLPPTQKNQRTEYAVQTEVRLLKSFVNNINYIFPADFNMKMNYYENSNYLSSSCLDKLNPYTQCASQNLRPVCVTGQKKTSGPFYPPITSLWKFSIKSKYQLPDINSKTPFFLRARIHLCSNGLPSRKRRSTMAEQGCCPKDKYHDPIERMAAERSNPCKSCPKGSTPRLEGYFCEECPIGQQPNNDLYGCEMCPPGTFKNSTGPATCK